MPARTFSRIGWPPLAENNGSRVPISFAALALVVVSSAIAVLLLTVLGVALVPIAAKPWVLVVGLIATVGAMALSSRYMTNKAIEREFGPEDSGTER